MRPLLGSENLEIWKSGHLAPGSAAEAERVRAYLLRYLHDARSRVDDATAAIRRTSEREMQLLLSSRWWRLIAPVRRASGWLHIAAYRARHRLTRSR